MTPTRTPLPFPGTVTVPEGGEGWVVPLATLGHVSSSHSSGRVRGPSQTEGSPSSSRSLHGEKRGRKTWSRLGHVEKGVCICPTPFLSGCTRGIPLLLGWSPGTFGVVRLNPCSKERENPLSGTRTETYLCVPHSL